MDMIQSPALEPVYTEQRPRGIDFDENGQPTGLITVEEWFDVLDRKLIAHFGEDFRKQLNEDRAEHGMKPLYTEQRPRGIDFDENGQPTDLLTTEEVFDYLGEKLIAHFGEDFRKQLNEDRVEHGMTPL
ncbi:MAG: hypothetical protein LBT83_03005 [Tannerella sp.]|jgi:hypothetical protein|nr:hypothetical protein [Tannerella sp.]